MDEIRKNLTGNSARDNKYLEEQILKYQDSEIVEAIYNEFLINLNLLILLIIFS